MEDQHNDKKINSLQDLIIAQKLLSNLISDIEYFDKLWEQILEEEEKKHGPIKRNKDGKPSLFLDDLEDSP